MGERILVPLRGSDRIEDFLPYIKQIAQPGMKVVFLVHYDCAGFKALMDQLPIVYPGLMSTPLSGTCRKESDFLRLLQEEISKSCGALRNQGTDITVDVHTRPLHKVLRQWVQRQDVHLVVMRAGFYDRLMYQLRNLCPQFFKPCSPPVLLLHRAKL